jgi:PAS domain S-box-containing protein
MLLVVAALSPLMVSLAVSLHEQTQYARRDASDNSLTFARLVGSRIDDNIRSIKKLLFTIEVAVAEDLASVARIDARLKAIQAELPPYVATISVLASDGRMISSSTVSPSDRTKVNFADRKQFRQAMATRAAAVGPLVRGRTVTGDWIVTITRPIVGNDDGPVRALVSLSLRVARIQEMLVRDNQPPGSVITVLDEHGTVLARSPDPAHWIGRSLSGEAGFQMARQNREFSGEMVSADGVTQLVGIASAREVPWLVSVGVPVQAALAPAQAQLIRDLVYATAAVLLAITLAWALSRFIAVPIRKLSDDTTRFSTGDLAHRSDVKASGEVGALVLNFNRMAARLERTVGHLRDSEAQLSGIITSAMDAIITIDEKHRMTLVNPAAERMFGYTTKDLIGNPINMLIPERFRTAHDDHIDTFGRTGITSRAMGAGQVLGLRADGEEFPVEASISQLGAPPDKFYTVILRDITARKQDEERLRQYAAQMRSLARRLREVEESERRMMHRELHDRVGANLTALKLELDMTLSGPMQGSEVAVRLGKARELLTETIAQIRDVMSDLRPAALDDFGLHAALRVYAGVCASRFQIPVTVSGGDIEPRLQGAAETALFRIAQEALNNIAKHAHARQVAIDVDANHQRVTMVIEDDGAGFDTAEPDLHRANWGLRTMRERAQAIGAELTIESTPGRGTRITVEVAREVA